MKEMIKMYAKYNKQTNLNLNKMLSKFEMSELFKERKTYYKSIGGLYLHLIYTSRYLQNMIRNNWNNKYFVNKYTEDSYKIDPQTFEEASELLEQYDKNLIEFSEKITDKDLFKPTANITLYNKKRVSVTIWKIVMQYIIHQTHHRGQISQILDELNIEHDIGNIWPLINEI